MLINILLLPPFFLGSNFSSRRVFRWLHNNLRLILLNFFRLSMLCVSVLKGVQIVFPGRYSIINRKNMTFRVVSWGQVVNTQLKKLTVVKLIPIIMGREPRQNIYLELSPQSWTSGLGQSKPYAEYNFRSRGLLYLNANDSILRFFSSTSSNACP